MTIEFTPYPKTPRLFRPVVITEKIDGTNAAITIVPLGFVPGTAMVNTAEGVGYVYAQSRKRLITPEDDNFGFARWVHENAQVLADTLGAGVHFGEWWGSGIQRGYGLPKGEKRFSLFNVGRWDSDTWRGTELWDAGLRTVSVLYEGLFDEQVIHNWVEHLRRNGSKAGLDETPRIHYLLPEGIVVYHTAARQSFKVLLENDDMSKTEEEHR